MSLSEPPGKSVLPIPPANKVSPVKTSRVTEKADAARRMPRRMHNF